MKLETDLHSYFTLKYFSVVTFPPCDYCSDTTAFIPTCVCFSLLLTISFCIIQVLRGLLCRQENICCQLETFHRDKNLKHIGKSDKTPMVQTGGGSEKDEEEGAQ